MAVFVSSSKLGSRGPGLSAKLLGTAGLSPSYKSFLPRYKYSVTGRCFLSPQFAKWSPLPSVFFSSCLSLVCWCFSVQHRSQSSYKSCESSHSVSEETDAMLRRAAPVSLSFGCPCLCSFSRSVKFCPQHRIFIDILQPIPILQVSVKAPNFQPTWQRSQCS